ncbi:MAG: hypothetical protein OEV64_12955 [Desulfobulbaceae bacterium]|nr:hypothetical protein [Desulfobulbaceae bacterium]
MLKLTQPLLIALICFITLLYCDTPEQQDIGMGRNDEINDTCMFNDQLTSGIIEKINREQPEVILLGNSMLGEGVGDRQLSATMRLKTVKVWSGGAASAWWYLVIKNILPQCKHRPRYLGIFFRDSVLTAPKFRVTGKYKLVIDDFSRRNETVLDRLAYLDDPSLVKYYLKSYFPLYRNKTDLQNSFDATIDELVEKITGVEDIRTHMSSCFSEEKMNKILVDQSQLRADDLNSSKKKEIPFTPARSFLPYIIEESKNLGVSLFFVRVKQIRDLSGGEPEEVKTYIRQLSAYLAEEKIPLLDFTHTPGFKKEFFRRGDHLNRQAGRTFFTGLLAERIQQEVLNFDSPAGEEKPALARQLPSTPSPNGQPL